MIDTKVQYLLRNKSFGSENNTSLPCPNPVPNRFVCAQNCNKRRLQPIIFILCIALHGNSKLKVSRGLTKVECLVLPDHFFERVTSHWEFREEKHHLAHYRETVSLDLALIHPLTFEGHSLLPAIHWACYNPSCDHLQVQHSRPLHPRNWVGPGRLRTRMRFEVRARLIEAAWTRTKASGVFRRASLVGWVSDLYLLRVWSRGKDAEPLRREEPQVERYQSIPELGGGEAEERIQAKELVNGLASF